MNRWLVNVVAGLLLVACETAATSTTVSTSLAPATTLSQSPTITFQEGTILAVLAADGRFMTLLELLREDAPDLLGFVSDERFNGTLFAPTDEAFAALDAGLLEEWRNREVGPNRSGLVLLLQHHVVSGFWREDQLRGLEAVGPGETEPAGGHGGAITIEVVGDVVRLDGALLIESDLEAFNGVIHVIDAVMIPEELGSPTQE